MFITRYLTVLLCVVVITACGSKKEAGFLSPEELKEAYRTSYKNGDIEAIMAMVYWDDTPEEIKATYKWIASIGIGEHSFEKLEVVPLDSLEFPENLTGEDLEPTLELTHWLVGSHSGNTGFEGSMATGTIQFAIGVSEQRYYISGVRYKTKNAELAGAAQPATVSKSTGVNIYDSAFRNAVRNGKIELVRDYIRNGYDIHRLGMGGENALHEGILHFKVAELLIAEGINVNQQHKYDGSTPLIVSSIGGNISVQTVKLLLENGADPMIKDRHGKTAIDYAMDNFEAYPDPKHGYKDKLKLLKKYMKQSEQAQQAGADQLATVPSSKPNENDKPQPESEDSLR